MNERHRNSTALVLCAYILLAAGMTWPLIARLGTHLAGDRGDLWVHQWTFWWVKHSIMEGQSPFHTNLLFYPQGTSLLTHNFAWLHIGVWLPLQALAGSVAAYNLVFLAVLVLNCFGMYLLAKDVTGSQAAGFIGGLICGFWPYALSHYDHPNLMVIGWIPLTLLYLRRTLTRGRRRDALLTALFLFLTGLTRLHLLIMGGVAVAVVLLYTCLTARNCLSRRTLSRLALIGLVAGVLLMLPAAPIAVAQLTQSNPGDIFIDEQTTAQTDLLAYVLPSHYHPVWGDAISRLYEDFTVNQFYVPFLGYTVIALALYGTARNWRQARVWTLMALVYFALALGPQLRVNGQLYPQVPMPYRLVGNLFFVRVLRRPDRFNVFLCLPLGMLASLGVKSLLHYPRLSRRTALVATTVSILILFEYCPVPFPTWRHAIPAWYQYLDENNGDFAILGLPTHSHTFDKRYMFYQITHGRPLAVGHVSRPPKKALTFIDNLPYLQYVRQHNRMDPDLGDVSHQLEPLAEAGIRYIVLHKNLASADQLADWQDWLTFDPCHEDADLLVYRTEPEAGRDFIPTTILVDDIGLIRATLAPTTTTQAGLIEADLRWGSIGTPGQDHDVCLNLVDSGGKVAQSQCTPLSPRWPPSAWEPGEVVRGTHALQVSPFAQPGPYSLTMTLDDSLPEAPTNSTLEIGTVQIESLPRIFELDDLEHGPAHRIEVQWGDAILLRGYDVQASTGNLELTLTWQALRRLESSYKVFVHLVDATTGDVLAQFDGVPRNWTYPTTWWERSEIVEETISLPLDEIPSGQVELIVGLYDQGTRERLPATSVDGVAHLNGAVVLTALQPSDLTGFGRPFRPQGS